MTRKQLITKLVSAISQRWNSAPEKLGEVIQYGWVGITELSDSELEEMYENLTERPVKIDE